MSMPQLIRKCNVEVKKVGELRSEKKAVIRLRRLSAVVAGTKPALPKRMRQYERHVIQCEQHEAESSANWQRESQSVLHRDSKRVCETVKRKCNVNVLYIDSKCNVNML